MRSFTTFNPHPANSPEYVEEIVTTRFRGEKMPDLLWEFIKLLGKEEEKWGGVEAMKACMDEFFRGCPQLKGQVPTVKDLEEFLFSPNRYVRLVIQGPGRPSTSNAANVIQGVVAPAIPETGSDRASSSKETIPRVHGPPANTKTLKGPSCPSKSKATTPNVTVPPASPKTLKGADRPSTSSSVNPHVVNQTDIPPANPKTLKVKIYMGSGWNNNDFQDLSRPPSLNVKMGAIDGSNSYETETKFQTKTAIPCWGKEFVFTLSRPGDLNLIVEGYSRSILPKKVFAGKIDQLVSERKQGIHTILLSNQGGNPCSSWLLVRLMFE